MVRDADRHALAVPLDPRLTQPVLYFHELPQGAVFQPCPPSVPVQDTFRSAVCRVGICCHQSFPVCLFYHSSQRVVAEMLFAAHGITDTFHLSKGVPLILRRPVCPACLSMLADTDQAACLIIGIFRPAAEGICHLFQPAALCVGIFCRISICIGCGNDIAHNVINI